MEPHLTEKIDPAQLLKARYGVERNGGEYVCIYMLNTFDESIYI